MSIEHFRAFLRNYVGVGWTTTGLPIGLNYLERIDKADINELLKIAEELNIHVEVHK